MNRVIACVGCILVSEKALVRLDGGKQETEHTVKWEIDFSTQGANGVVGYCHLDVNIISL